MRLRFTIRDLLWLTLVVAVSVGWWLDNRKVTQKFADYRSQAETTVTRLEADLVRHQADLEREQRNRPFEGATTTEIRNYSELRQ